MSETNKLIVQQANTLIARRDFVGLLALCTDDMEWIMVGGQTFAGKQALRDHLLQSPPVTPVFNVVDMIAERDFVTVWGHIALDDDKGRAVDYEYCDVWRLRDGKLAQLKAFIIETQVRDVSEGGLMQLEEGAAPS